MSVGRHPDAHGNLVLTAPIGAAEGASAWSRFERSDGGGGASGLPWRGLEKWLHEPQIQGSSSDESADGGGGWHLPSLGLDVSLVLFYLSFSTANGGCDGSGLEPSFGYRWRLSTDLRLQVSLEAPAVVTLTRGDGHTVQYRDEGCGHYKAITPGCFNTLEQNFEEGLWVEKTPDGCVFAYPLDLSGASVPILKARDAIGNTHIFHYDAQGRLLSLVDALGRSVEISYAGGLLSGIRDWAGRTLSFSYDTQNAGAKPLLTKVTDAERNSTSYRYELIHGEVQLVGVEDAQGHQTSYDYDHEGRVIRRTVVGVGDTFYSYLQGQAALTDAEGNTTLHWVNSQGNWTGWSDALGHGWSFARNAQEQITQVIDPEGGFASYGYNSQTGALLNVTDALGYATRIERDRWSNPTRITHSDGVVEELAWGFENSLFDETGEKRRLQARVDALGQATKYLYDERGLLLAKRDALGHVTGYCYDEAARLSGVVDAQGHTSRTTYDEAGRVLSRWDALGHAWRYAHDKNGNAVSLTDPNGATTRTQHDTLGRKIVQIDAMGRRTEWEYNAFDQPTRMRDGSGETAYAYDLAGRLIDVRDPLGHATIHRYDDAGRLEETIDLLGHATRFGYDGVGRLVSVSGPHEGTKLTRYNTLGQVEARVDDFGAETTYRYDARGRLTQARDALGQVTNYRHDARGSLLSMSDASGTTTYARDELGRVTSISNPLGETTLFRYDELGREVEQVLVVGVSVQREYDAAGREALLRHTNGQGVLIFERRSLYDGMGNRRHCIEQSLGAERLQVSLCSYDYDEDGQLMGHRKSGLDSSISYRMTDRPAA